MNRTVLIALIAVAMTSTALSAQESNEKSRDENVVGLFFGATTKFKDRISDETGFTIAGEYEYIPAKWDHKWGFAGVIELIFMHELEGILVPLVYYHATENWLVRGGVGFEFGFEEDATSGSASLLVRTGIGYAIPVKNLVLVPSFDFDYVRSDIAIVFGVVIAREF
jgi:hypothetical protein